MNGWQAAKPIFANAPAARYEKVVVTILALAEKHITQSKGCAIRLKIDEPVCFFHDRKHGRLAIPPALANEDFVIKRSDGLFAYNLAVVLDDIDKNITEVVRGADLMSPLDGKLACTSYLTSHQLAIYTCRWLLMQLDKNYQNRTMQPPLMCINQKQRSYRPWRF